MIDWVSTGPSVSFTVDIFVVKIEFLDVTEGVKTGTVEATVAVRAADGGGVSSTTVPQKFGTGGRLNRLIFFAGSQNNGF